MATRNDKGAPAPTQEYDGNPEQSLSTLLVVSIPMLSLLVFASVTGMLWSLKRRQSS